ncbi:MAG TPA: site-2 protease family protein [Thiolinea sp.]|nr:site-2 protease family protein [Thiolinea sp.]
MKIDQRHYDKKPSTTGENLLVYGLSAVFLGLMLLEIFGNYEPRKLAALFFMLWWLPLVLVHEFGHAVVANALGWQIQRTVIGFGRVVYQGQLFKAPLELRLIPIEGFVQFNPVYGRGMRYKHALTYFAGPGIELLVAASIIGLMGWDNFFLIEDDYWKLAFQALAYAALAGAIINLIPMGVITRDGETPNDGLGILVSLFSSEKDYKKSLANESESEDPNSRPF